jgi:general secretion pathway protein A
MYKDFFGLKGSPFELSPDPSFMVASDRTKEALTAISSAVGQRKGFVVMTGEVGTGKTLVLRCLFELWEREQIPFAYFIGPRLSATDFLSYINFELGIKVSEPTKGNLLRALYGFLLAQFEKGLTTVLIVDEAHQVSRSVLEEIRLLTNFETAQQKLVQIVLVGQPELEKKLDSVELRSLKQRIAIRCKLEPLRPEEIRNYVERRLELAGANLEASTIFPVETVKAIYRYSQGIPRLINNICDQALIAACASEVRIIPAEIIDEIASRFRLEPTCHPKSTERPFSPAGRTEARVTDKSLQAAPEPDAPSDKPPNQDTVLLYLDLGNAPSAQTTLPSLPETSNRASASDSPSYTRRLGQEFIDRDRIREVLTELDLQSWDGEPSDVRNPSGSSALSAVAAPSQANGTSQTGAAQATYRAAPSVESVALAQTATQLTAFDRVIFPSDAQTRRALARTAEPTEPEGIAALIAPDGARETWAATAANQQPMQYTSLEALEPQSTQVEPEKVIERDGASEKHDKEILIGALAAALLLLALGIAIYLRRPSAASAISSALPSAQARAQPSDLPAQSISGRPASGANPDLLAYKQLGQPSTPSTKPLFGHLRLAKPKLNRSAKSLDAGDPDVAPLIDGKSAPNPDELSAGLAPTKQILAPPPSLLVGGEVKPARLLKSISPAYPSLAKNQHLSGDVRIDALIDANGDVSAMTVLSGPLLLQESAKEALHQWKYQPATLNGKPVPMHLAVTIQFRLD